jgi:curved DNA-binding protein CbpA
MRELSAQRTYYEILGVDPQASADDVRSAFRRLARERHPDRYTPEDRLAAEREFQAITEAYNVLSDPERRARYDQGLANVSRPNLANPREVARALVAKAIGLMKLGEHRQAGELLGQAVAHDPQSARARHLYGLFLAQHAGRLDEGLRQLDQAVKLDSVNVRLLLDASRLFALARMFTRATRLAQVAAELSPGDPAVELWLRQLHETAARNEGAKR